MIKFIALGVLALFVGTASAEYQITPAPSNVVLSTATKRAAANIGHYVVSFAGINQGVPGYSKFDANAHKRVIKSGMSMCYSPTSALSYSKEKPLAPAVCIEDAVSLANTLKTYSNVAKYNAKLPAPLTEETFKAALEQALQ